MLLLLPTDAAWSTNADSRKEKVAQSATRDDLRMSPWVKFLNFSWTPSRVLVHRILMRNPQERPTLDSNMLIGVQCNVKDCNAHLHFSEILLTEMARVDWTVRI